MSGYDANTYSRDSEDNIGLIVVGELMNKSELLFYDAYEDFYKMAKESNAFKAFCKEAFGEDFSQDGFSNIEQIDRILEYVPSGDDVHILDIGCGNGKMLGYLQEKTGAYIHGFDYSAQAIQTAKALFPAKSEFREGIIGEIEYPEESFDVITSMDSMYFAKDMTAFGAQIKKWLKPNGIFFVGYQEGDVMPKTESVETTVLVDTLRKNGMSFEVKDITKQTYKLLTTKREAAIAHKEEFEAEGYKEWFDLLMWQTECVKEPFEQFKEKMARYIFVARKSLSYDGRKFVPQVNTENGEADGQTVFEYHQDGNMLWADYCGGEIIKGQLLGTVDANGELDFYYQHINLQNQIRVGKCHSIPQILGDGKIELCEEWQWLNGDMSKGSSVIREI